MGCICNAVSIISIILFKESNPNKRHASIYNAVQLNGTTNRNGPKDELK